MKKKENTYTIILIILLLLIAIRFHHISSFLENNISLAQSETKQLRVIKDLNESNIYMLENIENK